MLQDGWAERLTAIVGRRVAHFRKEAGISAQTLADRCRDEVGHRIDRAVIANIERGHRQNVTLAEVLVLARALRVPPVSLVVPLGSGEPVEVLPGTSVDGWHAVKWWAGRAALGPDGEQRAAMRPLNLFRMQDEDLGRLRAEAAGVRHWRRLADEEPDTELRERLLSNAEVHLRHMERLGAGIADARRQLRADGLDPGALPPDVDVPESDDGR